MGTSRNGCRCDDCEEEFDIALEWTQKATAIKIITDTSCPNCHSENWYFTDSMGQ